MMIRFNLLLVSQDAQMGDLVLRSLSRVFRDNFVFNVPSMADAEKLLQKLNIDLLLVDLDSEPADLVRLNEKYPGLQAMGVSSYTSLNSRIDPMRHKLLRKQDLSTELLDELKSLKKERGERVLKSIPKNIPVQANNAEYKDFSALVSSVR